MSSLPSADDRSMVRAMKRRSVRAGSDGTLEAVLAASLPTTPPEARALVTAGAVYVDGRRSKSADAPVKAGQVVMVVLEERGQSALAASAPVVRLRILFEDDHVLAIDKPAGITAQPTPSKVGESLLDFASAHLGYGAGLVHRLDRETSGVTVFGKSKDATGALAAAFKEGAAKKRYVAIAAGTLPPDGLIDLRLSADPSRKGRYRASRTANGQTALTRFEVLASAPGAALVALYPQTGRTHQLRAHLTALGAPIAGDALYGGPDVLLGLPAKRVLLHAQQLTLPHPLTGAPLTVESALPEDLALFEAKLGAPPRWRGP